MERIDGGVRDGDDEDGGMPKSGFSEIDFDMARIDFGLNVIDFDKIIIRFRLYAFSFL